MMQNLNQLRGYSLKPIEMDKQWHIDWTRFMRFKMDFGDFFLTQCDLGEDGKTGKFHQNASTYDTASCYSWRSYSDYRKGDQIDSGLKPSEQKALDLATKIAATAMLYYSARPEFIVDYTLPRSQRFKQIGSREHIKRVLLPTEKKYMHATSKRNQAAARCGLIFEDGFYGPCVTRASSAMRMAVCELY